VAENLGRLGMMPALLTVVGDDPEGELLLTHCAAGGVYVTQVHRVPGERTGSYTAILNEGGNMIMAFADMDLYERLTVGRLLAAWPFIAQAEVVTADTNLPEPTLHTLIERARKEQFRLAVVSASVPKVQRLPNSLAGVDLSVLPPPRWIEFGLPPKICANEAAGAW
jgi:pseudouridine kinase